MTLIARTAMLAGLAVATVAMFSMLARRRDEMDSVFAPIRPAGPENTRFTPKDWDIVDEAADQPIPARPPFESV